MPRTTERTRRAAQPDPSPQPPPESPPRPHSPQRPQRKRTVAENSKAIGSIETQLSSMSNILSQVVERLDTAIPSAPVVSDHVDSLTEDLPPHSSRMRPTPTRYRHRSDAEHFSHPYNSRQRHNSVYSSTSNRHHLQLPRGVGGRAREQHLDPLSSNSDQPPRRHLPTTIQNLDDSADLQERVAHLVSAQLAPPHLNGKKLYAHSYVRRGIKKSRTNLGELTLAEYNLGFIRLIHSREVDPADRPYMFQHLQHINEDATVYEFSDVRAWSEEVCGLVAEGDLTWDEHYTIDLLRLKMSQRNHKGAASADAVHKPSDGSIGDLLADFPADIRAARPAPPCRQFNVGNCTHKTHHTVNGYRTLHICSSCIYFKCLYFPHPEKDCKSKEYRKRNQPKEAELGFGR